MNRWSKHMQSQQQRKPINYLNHRRCSCMERNEFVTRSLVAELLEKFRSNPPTWDNDGCIGSSTPAGSFGPLLLLLLYTWIWAFKWPHLCNICLKFGYQHTDSSSLYSLKPSQHDVLDQIHDGFPRSHLLSKSIDPNQHCLGHAFEK